MDRPSRETALPASASHILALARRDRARAREAFGELGLDEAVALVCETPLARRAELLDLARHPEQIIPRLPEAELCFTVKAVGLGDAGWILEHATPEQLVAAVDLDAWSGDVPDRAALGEWLAAYHEAGDDTLLRAAHSLDAEALVLALRDRVEVELKPNDDEDWQPPEGAQTLEGQFYLKARADGDDLAPLLRLLGVLFQKDYWLYFRLLQGTLWELESDCEEWALRWRTGRLEDLGFPPREEAVAVYARLRPEERLALPEGEGPIFDTDAWRLPVWLPNLPAAHESGHVIFRAVEDLPDAARAAFFHAFVALANRVAVADRLPLGDAESLPAAIEKAARLASVGLETLARTHGVDATQVLARAGLERLFRLGAELEDAAPPAP